MTDKPETQNQKHNDEFVIVKNGDKYVKWVKTNTEVISDTGLKLPVGVWDALKASDVSADIQQRKEKLEAEVTKLREALGKLEAELDSVYSVLGVENANTTKRANGGKRKEQVKAVLRESPGLSQTEIAERLGVSPQSLYYLLKDMTASGEVRKVEHKYYLA